MIKLVLFLIAFMLSSSLFAEVYYIKPKAYLDVVSGKMIFNKVIGIENNIIRSIVSRPPHGKIVQTFNDLFFLPGLIDCHTHIFFTQKIADKTFEMALLREVRVSDVLRTERAKRFLSEYLEEGFTSVCDLGNSGNFLDVKLKKEIISDFYYPDLYISGQGFSTFKAQFAPNTTDDLVKKEYLIIDGKANIDSILQDYYKKGIDIIKVYSDNSPGVGEMDLELIKKIIQSPVAAKFKKVTFHAIDKKSVDTLLKISSVNIEHGSNAVWGTIAKNRKVNLTMTDLPMDILKEFNYYNKALYSYQIHRAKLAYRKRINLIFGSDFYFDKEQSDFNRAKYVKKSLDAWKEAGVKPVDIIRAMTINASRSLKESDNVGIIRVGARANLIGIKENPLKDISSLRTVDVIINKGKIIKAPHLD